VTRIHPEIIVCLGATAAQSILGNTFRLTQERGKFIDHPWAPRVTATVHPSAILRAPDEERVTWRIVLLWTTSSVFAPS